MSGVPSIPFKVESLVKIGNTIRREVRNAITLAQATEIYEKELRKPHVRRADLWLCIDSRERRGGVPE